MHPTRLSPVVVLASALSILLATLALAGGAAARSAPIGAAETTYPLIDFRGAADPTVVRYGDQWVAISTGPSAPRAVAPAPNGPWTDAGNALTVLPPWALNNRIWASDLVQNDDGWVMYFSAPVAGLGPDGRCIGAATARTPLDSFVPQAQPLICPRKGVSAAAYDIARPVAKGLPKRLGVIDPEGFTDRDGKRYVLYRTQSRPSSFRIVKVPRSGLARAGLRNDSTEMFRRRGVVENPVLVRRGKFWVLFSSQSYFGDCGYQTTWRKARSLEGLKTARKHVLLDQDSTGLCGPGGADLLEDSALGSAQSVLFFHAWTCPQLRAQCPAGIDYDKTPSYGSHRAMFGATLAWSRHGKPSISSYLVPAINPFAEPTPTPTASPDPA